MAHGAPLAAADVVPDLSASLHDQRLDPVAVVVAGHCSHQCRAAWWSGPLNLPQCHQAAPLHCLPVGENKSCYSNL